MQYVLNLIIVDGYFNLEHFDINLMKDLMPTIYTRDRFNFENINFLREKDIESFEIFSDYFIDINFEKVFGTIFFWIYPQLETSKIKNKFENIETLLKFIETITEEL